MAFGILPDQRVSYVCASKMTSRGEEFMQPYLAPDKAFLEVLRYSRFTYMFKQCSTDYIVAFQDSDGKQQLCIITYGCRPLEKRFSPYETTCYVALSFYDIPGDFYTSEDRHFHEPDVYASYADEKTKDGGVIRRYFSAKFLYTKHFIINNFSFGTIETCFLWLMWPIHAYCFIHLMRDSVLPYFCTYCQECFFIWDFYFRYIEIIEFEVACPFEHWTSQVNWLSENFLVDIALCSLI